MKSKRALLYKIGALVLLLALAATMFVVGRGHTVYLDNKTLEYNGETYSAAQRVNITVGGEKIAKLAKRERGMSTCIGQRFTMELEVTQTKGDDPVTQIVTLDLPYNLDGVVINLPGYLAGLPEEAYLSEFVSMATTEEEAPTEEEVVTEEFGLSDL